MSPLTQLIDAGFFVELNQKDNLLVWPIEYLTDVHRTFIRTNKPEIVRELTVHMKWHVVFENEDVCMSILPGSTLAEVKEQFPRAVFIEAVELIH